MSQSFKLKFDHLKQNDPTNMSDCENSNSTTEYPNTSNARNLCLIWLSGRKQFLNYSYLVSCEFDPEDNIVTLQFTTHFIILTGDHLNGLFDSLINHSPKTIKEIEERYKALDSKEPYIASIESISI